MNELPPFFENKNFFFKIVFLLFFVVLGALLFSLGGVALSKLIWPDAYDALSVAQQAHYVRFNQAMSMLGVWLVPALLFSYGHYRNVWRYNRADVLPSATLLKWTILLAFLLLPAVYVLAYLNQSVHLPDFMTSVEEWMRAKEDKAGDILKVLTENSTISSLLLNLLVMGVMPAVCEEFFFQGTLQPLLMRSMRNKHLAIWLTAFIFSAIHLQFLGFVPRFLLGAYLGYLFVWSGSLWLPIVAHMLHNVCSLLLQFAADRQGVDTEDPSTFVDQLPTIIPIVVVASVVAGYGIYKLWKNRIQESELTD